MTVEEAALGALQLQKFGMTQSIELNSVRRGYDPRDFTLVAAGGAGPLFACDIALELDIPRVLVPPNPGIIAATGLLVTDIQHEFVATERHQLESLDQERLQTRFDELGAEAVAQLERDSVPEDRRLVRRLADCRYAGQGYEVRFDVPAGDVDDDWVEELKEGFHRAHEAEYGHRFDAKIEVVNIRVVGIGRVEPLQWTELEDGERRSVSCPDPAQRRGVRGRRQARHPVHPVLRALEAARRRSHRRAGGDRAVRHHHGGAARARGRWWTATATSSWTARRAREPELGQTGGLATPILMRVIGGAFSSIAKEMAGVLYRMSYSSIIRESEDLGAGIFDADGNVLAESDSTPMFMGAMPKIVKGVISLLGDDIHEGDVILHNDPYLGATHSPDVAIVMPVFFEGELIGFSGASAHLLDIGGAFPGIAVDFVDNWSEGSIYRAVKLADKGVWQTGLWEHILGNTRTPTHNRGDIQAMIAACELANRRYGELLEALRQGGRARRRAGLALLLGADAAPGDRQGAGRRLRDRRRLARRRRQEPRREAAGEGRGRDRGRRDHDRSHRLERRGADRLQLPLRGHDRLGDDVHHPDDLPRRGGLSGVRAPERGHAQARST